ncbi:bifunctional UDP-N-acetylglucosamine diphosphorylase/glucosamine-1-phosphate N-acetyltransferase GlmU [bacterium]|nr:bifunctional UDP-N-acetylglucosamine diphosphorylase/glucosamine-1-phosphate N-acetyltransferase GlmU [bacterium]
MMENLAVVILAAGKGKRMKSALPKVLHKICGRPMLEYVLDLLPHFKPLRKIVILGHQGKVVEEFLKGKDVEVVYQREQLGTGHALLTTKRVLADFEGTVLVLSADTPFLTKEALLELISVHRKKEAVATVLTCEREDARGYGRIVRDEEGLLRKIVEERDAGAEEKAIREVNTGTYCFDSVLLFWALSQLKSDNDQEEYYLTDCIWTLKEKGHPVETVKTSDPNLSLGINSRIDLALAEKILRSKILNKLMLEGVTIIDPDTAYIDAGVEIGRDTIIYPSTSIFGPSSIGRDCIIGPGSTIMNTRVGDKASIYLSFVSNSTISNGASIGPFAHIRSETRVSKEEQSEKPNHLFGKC